MVKQQEKWRLIMFLYCGDNLFKGDIRKCRDNPNDSLMRRHISCTQGYAFPRFKSHINALRFCQVQNLSDGYIEQLQAIEGFEVASAETSYQEGLAIRTTRKVVALEAKEPPDGAYAVPDGCTKKDKLTLDDLRN